jgi:beta-lactam-binding protein with PASTA domain
MATRRELPADVAAALDRVPEARDRFAALPPERQVEWLNWVDHGRGRRGRAARTDEMVRRLLPAETADPAGPPPERYWWLWLLLLLLLVIGGLLAWWLLARGDDKATVPNVIGLRAPVAVERIHEKDLDATSVTGPSKRPPGIVFAQRPGAGTQLGEGENVVISVSSGRLAVPDVSGQPLQQAEQELTSAGFKTEVKRLASSRPKDIVIEQSPAAGVTAATGTTVTLTVSSGAKPVVVPQVVGQTQGAAVNALTAAGLKPVLHNVPSSRPAGTVVAQKPPAGNEVDKSSTVTLNVSTGTGPATTTTGTTTSPTTTSRSVSTPKVTGLAAAPALRRLNVQGLFATVVFQESDQPAGRVLTQSPAAATSAQRGSRVRITVSTGPNPQPAASVPDVTGQDRASATDALRSAGFRVLVLNRPTTNQGQDGNVIEQQPRAGSDIPGGSLVAIYIGRLSG